MKGVISGSPEAQVKAARAQAADQSRLHRYPFADRRGGESDSLTEGNVVSPTSDVLTTIVSQDPVRSAGGVARAASQIDLQLLELGNALIDAALPYLVQRSPNLRR